MKMKRNRLVIFNLSMNLDNHVLANTNLWVNEFSKHFEKVHVFSTHVGRYSVPNNVCVEEIGGGNLRKRSIAIVKLTLIAFKMYGARKDVAVFHHQSPRTAVFPGILFRIIGVKQGLWYSHSSNPPSLIGGAKIVNYVFSSTVDSIPMKSRKSIFLGHGIDTQKALKVKSERNTKREGILFLGRIDRIKKLEECIIAIKESGYEDLKLTLVGPSTLSTKYLIEIMELAELQKIDLAHEPPIDHDDVFRKMANFDMFFAGMRNSVDKSCLEAAACGCFVITSDLSSAELSGMKSFWKELLNIDVLPKVSEQIKLIRELDFETSEKFRSKVQRYAISKNSAEQLVSRVSNILESN